MSNISMFLLLSKRQKSSQYMDGWTLEKFKKLSPKDQAYLNQFVWEMAGYATHATRKLLTADQLRAVWREHRTNYNHGIEPSSLLAFDELDEAVASNDLNPEEIYLLNEAVQNMAPLSQSK